MANGAERMLEEYDEDKDKDGKELLRILRAGMLEMLQNDKKYKKRIKTLNRFMYIMTGAWIALSAIITAGYLNVF